MASLWAIGDLHGQLMQLEALLAALPRGENDVTVFIGDYIDRGPDSAGVVRRVLAEYAAAPERVILLWGNHEDMAAYHYHLPRPSSYLYDEGLWLENGGVTALRSFGFSDSASRRGTAPCPPELARLFGLLKPFWRPPADIFPELAHVVFAHAGVTPGKRAEEDAGDALLWIREGFLQTHDASGRLVVHGHTPFNDARVLPDKIGIDTGAVYGNLLTALQLPERRIYQADGQNVVTQRDLPVVETPSKVKKQGG